MLALLLLLFADPNSFETVFRAGLTALSQNQLSAARAQLESASKLKPDDARVWLALAQTYRKLKEDTSSKAAIAKAESLAGNDPATLHGLAYLYSEAGNYEKAASFEVRYADLSPGDANATPRAVELYLRAGKPEPAIALAVASLGKNDRADLHGLLAQAYSLQNNHANAAEQMRRAFALNPYEESYYFEAARESLMDGNPAAAIRTVQVGRKIFSRSAHLELVLGIADYALEEYDDAVNAFLTAIHIDPTAEQPYAFIARTMDHTPSRLPEILSAFKTLAAKAPDDYRSNYYYGKALLANGDYEQAEACLRKSIRLSSDHAESHLELGKALQQKGDLETALAEFRKSIELNSKNATAHYRLAGLYDRLGQPEQAKVEYAIHQKLLDQEESGPFRNQGLTKDIEPARR